MSTMLPLLVFIAGYAAIFGIAVLGGFYANPMWGGENLFLLWWVATSLIPGLLISAYHCKRLPPILQAIIGAMYMALQFPAMLAGRWFCGLIGANSWYSFFVIYGAILILLVIVFFGIEFRRIRANSDWIHCEESTRAGGSASKLISDRCVDQTSF